MPIPETMPMVFKLGVTLAGLVNGLVMRATMALMQPSEYYSPSSPGIGTSEVISGVVALVTALGLGGILNRAYTGWRRKVEAREREERAELIALRERDRDLSAWAAGAVATAAAQGVTLPDVPPRRATASVAAPPEEPYSPSQPGGY
ncbi:MAG: hypothetical protein AAF791_05465 [Bacteroidota bacterium]